ncbi:MAG: hypothetical protein R2769_16640 [Saprospiraceae bacterium]
MTIQRYWIAEDTCGNADTLIQLVTIIDTIPPQITAFPQNVVLQCEGGLQLQTPLNLWVATVWKCNGG